MSNKNLLNESTIRKFMKLASIEPLADSFVSSRIQESEEELEEGSCGKVDDDKLEEADDELEEGYDMKKDEELEEGHGMKDHDKELEEDIDLDEMGGGMMYKDDDDMGGADKMLNMNDFLDILEKAVEEFLGEPTDIERDEEPADDLEMDMDMEAEPEGDLEMDVDLEMDAEEGDEDEEELEEAKEEDLAETIYKQVLKKLSK